MSKSFMLANSILTTSFSLTLPFVVDYRATIYINLPLYYNVYDNPSSLVCQVNSMVAYCTYTTERTIRVKVFTTVIGQSSPLTIAIMGVV